MVPVNGEERIDQVFHRHNHKHDRGLVREGTRRHTLECSVEKGPNFRTSALLATAKLIRGKGKSKLFQEWGTQCSENASYRKVKNDRRNMTNKEWAWTIIRSTTCAVSSFNT